MKKRYFSVFEIALWTVSVAAETVAFCLVDKNILGFVATIIGTTSLLFIAKGNPVGQGLTIVFSILYGIIAFRTHYYGEMITYLGMTLPMAIAALISWLRNPFKGKKSEVKVKKLSAKEIALSLCLTAAVTVAFYFILRALETNNLIVSTISVATSFEAMYLTFRRSPYYALAYLANDIVLIVLWSMHASVDISYLSVALCFGVYFVFDIYGFVCWKKMEKRQE